MPPLSQGFQSQNGAIFAKLHSRPQEGECISVVPEHRMAPKIQPSIRFTEYHAFLRQPLSDISGHAKKPVSGRDINSFILAFLSGALDHPVCDPIGQLLCSGFQIIGQVSQCLQLVHDLQSLLSASQTQNTLQTNDTTSPHSGLNRVLVAVVGTDPLPERSP